MKTIILIIIGAYVLNRILFPVKRIRSVGMYSIKARARVKCVKFKTCKYYIDPYQTVTLESYDGWLFRGEVSERKKQYLKGTLPAPAATGVRPKNRTEEKQTKREPEGIKIFKPKLA